MYRFDPFTVNMKHPDSVIALISGNSYIVAHGASVPFDYLELRNPNVKTILSSYDILDGPTTFTMLSTTARFYQENPRIMAALMMALNRAQEMIRENKRDAAQVLLDSMGGKGWSVDDLVKILDDPTTIYVARPQNVLRYADFMFQVGSIKHQAKTIEDLFFPSPEVAGGN